MSTEVKMGFFSARHAGVSKQVLSEKSVLLLDTISSIRSDLDVQYATAFASLALSEDADMRSSVKTLARKKRKLKPDLFILIGIGGSNLGAMAVQNFLGASDVPVKYLETLDSDAVFDIIEIIRSCNGNVLINLVSKSGQTTESIANFQVLFDALSSVKSKISNNDVSERIVVTTDSGSKLDIMALSMGFDVLHIPKLVGGRFSVLSPAGLFPLAFMGFDIDAFASGALEMRNICISKTAYSSNPAMVSALILDYHINQGISMHNMFMFSPVLESLGKWYRQLLAESLGKRRKAALTPIISIGSTDLHSMAQLYLAGPVDKFTTFVSVPANKCIRVPKNPDIESLLPDLSGKSLQDVMSAIFRGVRKAYIQEKLPFSEISLSSRSEREAGRFMQFCMLQTIFLASLLHLNPFDQPAVELYKKHTRDILKSS